MKPLLLSEKTLKETSLVNNNVDAEYIQPAIRSAQEEGLQPLIGTCLYDKLCELVQSGDIQSAEQYKYFLDTYVTPYLVNKTQSELTIAITYKIRNAGVVTNNDGNYSQISIKDIQYLKELYDNKSKFSAERMMKYLCVHSADFPEYCHCNDCSEMPSNRHGYNTNIFLG